MDWRVKAGTAVALRDLIVILVATAIFATISLYFNVGELVLGVIRPNDSYDVDEIPGVLVFAALALALFAWRRMAEVQAELAKRLAAENELVTALDANRRLARENVRIQEDERRNLARELHDEFGQYVNAIKVDAVSIRAASAETPDDIHDAARSIIEITDRIQGTMRETIARLRPAGLDELGLVAALEHCVDGWRKRLPAVQFEFTAPDNAERWDEAVNITLYRVVQEGLTNVAKHAGAAHVEIRLDCRMAADDIAGDAMLTVIDDGQGARAGPTGQGLGLVGMRERVAALGGSLVAAAGPRGGYRLEVQVPVHRVTEERP
jgi:signal transduction histidine kinase